MRILKQDGITELNVYYTRTNAASQFTQTIQAPPNISLDEHYYLEAILSPTLGTGPADSGGMIEFSFRHN